MSTKNTNRGNYANYAKADPYEEITNRFIAALEQGEIPWKKPWNTIYGYAVSHTTGKPYSLLNQFMLGEKGEYLTYEQAVKEGGHVKKGAKARYIYFWKILTKPAEDKDGNKIIGEDGTLVMRQIPVLKSYAVFHTKDCEGIEEKWTKPNVDTAAQPDERAENVFRDYVRREGITLEECETSRAYYSPKQDLIHVPFRYQFEKTAEYYSTVFHESVHSTGAANRLKRFGENSEIAAFGGESYSKEELVAEMGAACILNSLGLETDSSFTNSVAYLQNWLKALKNDKKFIVTAASRAEKAAKYILNIEPDGKSNESDQFYMWQFAICQPRIYPKKMGYIRENLKMQENLHKQKQTSLRSLGIILNEEV